MPKWKEGDRVRVVSRPVTEEDRKANRYYEHMAGLLGEVQNVYADKIAVRVDLESLSGVSREVHRVATERMRDKFAASTPEEQKKALTKEQMEFTPHYVVLVSGDDLEKG